MLISCILLCLLEQTQEKLVFGNFFSSNYFVLRISGVGIAQRVCVYANQSKQCRLSTHFSLKLSVQKLIYNSYCKTNYKSARFWLTLQSAWPYPTAKYCCC